jgi:hypothetical protein
MSWNLRLFARLTRGTRMAHNIPVFNTSPAQEERLAQAPDLPVLLERVQQPNRS